MIKWVLIGQFCLLYHSHPLFSFPPQSTITQRCNNCTNQQLATVSCSEQEMNHWAKYCLGSKQSPKCHNSGWNNWKTGFIPIPSLLPVLWGVLEDVFHPFQDFWTTLQVGFVSGRPREAPLEMEGAGIPFSHPKSTVALTKAHLARPSCCWHLCQLQRAERECCVRRDDDHHHQEIKGGLRNPTGQHKEI